MDLGLRDRAYLVTGGSRGLGRAAAQALLDDDAHVVIGSRDTATVARAAAEIGAHGIAVDNADPATPRRLVDAALERFGRIDGALISVGGPPAGSITDVDDEQWRAAFESVFLGAVRLARTVAEELGDGGSIVFVLSSSTRSPIDGLAISNGLRPGLAMAAKTLADEVGQRGVRVNGVLPGRVDTDRIRELDALGGDPEGARKRLCASIPLRRYGTPEEFGKVAAFLLSPAAGYVSGAMLSVDGGALRTI